MVLLVFFHTQYWNIYKFRIPNFVFVSEPEVTSSFGDLFECVLKLAIPPELSTGRMDPRVGSGRVTILPDFGGSGRVGSALRIY